MTRGKHANTEALLALTRDMNKYTRFVCKPNRGHGNVTGADNVVAWRTGYPFGVNLGRGYPRFNPGEYTASDILARRRSRCGHDPGERPDGELQREGSPASANRFPTSPWIRKKRQPRNMRLLRFTSPRTGSMCRGRSIEWTTSPSHCARLSNRRIPATTRCCEALKNVSINVLSASQS